jgi:hypothetical protein
MNEGQIIWREKRGRSYKFLSSMSFWDEKSTLKALSTAGSQARLEGVDGAAEERS